MDIRKMFSKKSAKKGSHVKITAGPKPLAVGKKTFARIVRKAAKSSHEEVKHASRTLENLVGHNSPIGTADAVALLPQITQGGDDFNRIGNRIYARGLYVKGRISATGGVQDDNKPLTVRVMILSQRNIKDSTTIPGSFAAGQLLAANDTALSTSTVAYDGTTRNSMYPVNKDMFQVHYKRDFVITPSRSGELGEPFGVEMNSRTTRRWACKVRIPRNLMYFNSSSVFPQNTAPFIVIGYCYTDGSNPDNVSTRVTSTTVSTLYYTDA